MMNWLVGDLGLQDLTNVVCCYTSDCSEQGSVVCSVAEHSVVWVFLSNFCQDGLDHVISHGAREDGLAFLCSGSVGELIQSGFRNTGGELAQTLRCQVQKGVRKMLPEALQDSGNYLYHYFLGA